MRLSRTSAGEHRARYYLSQKQLTRLKIPETEGVAEKKKISVISGTLLN